MLKRRKKTSAHLQKKQKVLCEQYRDVGKSMHEFLYAIGHCIRLKYTCTNSPTKHFTD